MTEEELAKLVEARDLAEPGGPAASGGDELSVAERRQLAEFRLLRVLACGREGATSDGGGMSADTLRQFVEESLPPDEMKSIETLIRSDDTAMAAYLDLRMQVATGSSPVPLPETVAKARARFVEGATSGHSAEHTEPFVDRIWGLVDALFPNRRVAALISMGLLVAAVVPGIYELSLYRATDPVVIAEAPPAWRSQDQPLLFRGGGARTMLEERLQTNSIAFRGYWPLDQDLADLIRAFKADPTIRTRNKLMAFLHDGSKGEIPLSVDIIQISPALATAIEGKVPIQTEVVWVFGSPESAPRDIKGPFPDTIRKIEPAPEKRQASAEETVLRMLFMDLRT